MSLRTLLTEHATDIELIMKQVILAVPGNLWKNPVFEWLIMEKLVLHSYGAKPCQIYYRHQNHHKTGVLSCFRHFSKNRVFQWLLNWKLRSTSHRNKTCRAVARHGQNSFCVVPGECGTDIEIVLKGVIRAVRGHYWRNHFLLWTTIVMRHKKRKLAKLLPTWKSS